MISKREEAEQEREKVRKFIQDKINQHEFIDSSQSIQRELMQ